MPVLESVETTSRGVLTALAQEAADTIQDVVQIDENRQDSRRFQRLQRHADGLDMVVFIEIADDQDDLAETNAVGIIGLASEALTHQLGDRQTFLRLAQKPWPIGRIEVGGGTQRRDRECAEEIRIIRIDRGAAGKETVEQP